MVFWGLIRVVLGIAQMTGAIILAVCLYRYGPGQGTMIILFITMGAIILSILLFRVLRVQGKDRR